MVIIFKLYNSYLHFRKVLGYNLLEAHILYLLYNCFKRGIRNMKVKKGKYK